MRSPRALRTFKDFEGRPIAERIRVIRKNVLDMFAFVDLVPVGAS